MLLGNKADLEDQRMVDEGEAKNLAESLGLKYFETSASTGQNVTKSVEALLDQVMLTNHLHTFHESMSCVKCIV